MRTATLTLAACLCAGMASASAIEVGNKHCHCSLVEVQPEAQPRAPDPGYDPALGAGEIARLQALDALHEPAYEPPVYQLVCFPRVPWGRPGEPGKPDVPSGGGGTIGGGGQPGVGGSVPEPASLALLGLAALASARRLRRRG